MIFSMWAKPSAQQLFAVMFIKRFVYKANMLFQEIPNNLLDDEGANNGTAGVMPWEVRCTSEGDTFDPSTVAFLGVNAAVSALALAYLVGVIVTTAVMAQRRREAGIDVTTTNHLIPDPAATAGRSHSAPTTTGKTKFLHFSRARVKLN